MLIDAMGSKWRNFAGDGGKGKFRDSRDGVEVRIDDTGPGIPAELREQIFNPFVTTKKTEWVWAFDRLEDY